MLPIKHILFPIDFSERACGAAPFVEAVANRFGAKVTLLNVFPPPFVYLGLGEPVVPVEIDTEALKADLKARLDGAFVRELARVPVERVVEMGDPAGTITRYAREHNVDLIMMPTHGYGPFRRFLLGSVAAKVLHDAECPVWTAAHTEEPSPAKEHLACSSVLCAVDRTDKSAAVIEWASEFAKAAGATLRLVHAVPGVEAWPERQFDREFESVLRDEAKEAIANVQRSVGVEAPLCISPGKVADVVRDEARTHATDLIVIGRGVLNEKFGRLRTNAYGIISHAPCPVISV
jgi:nucleotide-binding universal stress UspA family protein